MIINAVYDSSITSQNGYFQVQYAQAVNAAIAYFEHAFSSSDIYVTITFGWGEDGGTPIPSGLDAHTDTHGDTLYYAQVYNALSANQSSADARTAFSSLPATDPTNGGSFYLPYAQELALGLTPSHTEADYVGLSSAYSWTWDPNNRAVAGAHDAIGALEHEISEVLGRIGGLGQGSVGGGAYTPLDLFRYNFNFDPDHQQYSFFRTLSASNGYFSIDGTHLLAQYNNPVTTGEDAGDWINTLQGDSFGDNYPGVASLVTPTDLREMNVIGWQRSPATHDDFNGDAVSDVLFRNDSTGDFGYYEMNGSLVGWKEIGGSDTTYTVVGTGDFNGDFTADILFRNNATGDMWYAAMSNGGEPSATGGYEGPTQGNDAAGTLARWYPVAGGDTHYSVVGVADFYGNGTDDILFRNNTTGDTWFEAISNGAFAGWHQIGGSNTSYAVVGTGDFFGDGTDDALFRNNATGDMWMYNVNDGTYSGWYHMGGSSTTYSVVGVGDFLGVGTAAALLRNNATGDTGFENFTGWHDIGGSSTYYSVAAVGDYYGNGTSDILFRNNNNPGDVWMESINKGAFTGWHQIASSSNTSYTVKT
jgi:hypothetical protein